MAFEIPGPGGRVPKKKTGVTPGGGPPPTSPGSGGDTLGLNPPDWRTIIEGNADWIRRTGAIRAGLDTRGIGRRDAIRGMVARLGFLPKGFVDKYGDITPEDIAHAEANPNAMNDILQRMYDNNITRGRSSAEKMGALASGAAAQEAGLEGTAHGERTQQAVDQFLSDVGQIQSDFAAAAADAQTGIEGVTSDVGTAVKNDPQYSGAALKATEVPGSLAKYGVKVFQGPDGKLWTKDANGKAVLWTPPTATGGRIAGNVFGLMPGSEGF